MKYKNNILPEWYPRQFDNPVTMAIESVAVNGNLEAFYIEDADSIEGQELRLELYLHIAFSGGILTGIRRYHLN